MTHRNTNEAERTERRKMKQEKKENGKNVDWIKKDEFPLGKLNEQHVAHSSLFAKIYDEGSYIVKTIETKKVHKNDILNVADTLEKLKNTDHPNIAKVENFRIEKNEIRIKELKYGKNLSEVLKQNRKCSQTQAHIIIYQIVQGLAQLRKLNINVQKIRPSNIMLSHKNRWQAKVADFGLRNAVRFKQQQNMQQLIYDGPESAIRKWDSTRKIMWGLGIIFCNLVLGVLPFKQPKYQQFVVQYRYNKHEFDLSNLSKPSSQMVAFMIQPHQQSFDFNAISSYISAILANNNIVGYARKNPSQMPDYYQLTQQIGSGAFGTVYKFGNYAIKMINFKGMESSTKRVLKNEDAILSQIDHKNVVRLYESFYDQHDPNKFYIILEYCESSLQNLLKTSPNNRLSQQRALSIFKQVLNGYDEMRRLKIVHRDIKPDNILINGQNEIKLADFGFSRQVADFQNTMLKTRLGTFIFKSPQLIQSNQYGTKSQIWALGILLYKIMMGRFPFMGRTESDLLKNMQSGKPIDFTGVSITQQTQNIITRMLKVDSKERIQWDSLFQFGDGIVATQEQFASPKLKQDKIAKTSTNENINSNNSNSNNNGDNEKVTYIEQNDHQTKKQQNQCMFWSQVVNLCRQTQQCFKSCFKQTLNCCQIFKRIKVNHSTIPIQSADVQVEFSECELQQILKLQLQSSLDGEVSNEIIDNIHDRTLDQLNEKNVQHLQNCISKFNISMQKAMKQTFRLKEC